MRAVIPAFILLFIGLVAAIPFRRPPAGLPEVPPRSNTKSPLESMQSEPTALHPGSLPPTVGSYRSIQETRTPNFQESSLGGLQVLTPAAKRYDEVIVPLQKRSDLGVLPVPTSSHDSFVSASDSSRQPETTVLGKWKTGLGISTVEQRVPFDLCLPEIGTTKEIVERAKPTVPVLPTAANLINSAGRNSVTPSPETPSARVRQFIREPQLH